MAKIGTVGKLLIAALIIGLLYAFAKHKAIASLGGSTVGTNGRNTLNDNPLTGGKPAAPRSPTPLYTTSFGNNLATVKPRSGNGNVSGDADWSAAGNAYCKAAGDAAFAAAIAAGDSLGAPKAKADAEAKCKAGGSAAADLANGHPIDALGKYTGLW